MMKSITDEYEFLTHVGEHTSVGGSSLEWVRHTFTDKYQTDMKETVYVTANPNSSHLDPDDFLRLEEVWRDGWSPEFKTILPETVTDRAIRLHRNLDPKRMIIHYMQPHTPFVPYPEVDASSVGPGKKGDYGKHITGLSTKYSRDELWQFHVDNLRFVLNSLDVLLSNIDGHRTVISADHGQALGENGEWGHSYGSRVDSVRKVPWCITSATDSRSYIPQCDINSSEMTQTDNPSREEKLRYLGYKQ
jgi:hypothetical protein